MEESINSYNSANNNKLINNNKFTLTLYDVVSKTLQRPLSNNEKKYIQNLLAQDIPSQFINKRPSEILDNYRLHCVNKFKKNAFVYSKVNHQELAKAQLGLPSDYDAKSLKIQTDTINTTNTDSGSLITIGSFLGITDPAQYARLFTPSPTMVAGIPSGIGGVIKKEYITLDTRYRSLDNDGTTFYKWNAVYDNSTIQGGYNINQKVRNIVALKCYPIKMPYIQSADNDYGRITLLFQEFQSQAFIAHENTKYQFVYSTDINDRWIHLRTNYNNEGVFSFSTPVTQLSSLTAYFRSPWEPIVFNPDRGIAGIELPFGTPASGGYGVNTTFITTAPHYMETGDRVYITGFTSANTSSDASIISAVDNPYGNLITYINDTSFSIGVDSSNMFKQGDSQVTLTFGSATVIGIATSFVGFFQEGDYIAVTGLVPWRPFRNKIIKIISNTELIVEFPFTFPSGNYIYYRFNVLANNNMQVYYGSTRIFMNFEVSYIDSGNNLQ